MRSIGDGVRIQTFGFIDGLDLTSARFERATRTCASAESALWLDRGRRTIAAFGSQKLARFTEPALGEEPSRTRKNFMLKKLIVTSIVAAFAFLTPALAQAPAPDANAPAAESDQAKPAKPAHKKHKKHAKKAKAKTEGADTEKKDGDAK
jgi:hypothetical protein